jgi:hypothetical protein
MGGVAQMPTDDEERRRRKEELGVEDDADGFLDRVKRFFKKDEPTEKAENDASPGTPD